MRRYSASPLESTRCRQHPQPLPSPRCFRSATRTNDTWADGAASSRRFWCSSRAFSTAVPPPPWSRVLGIDESEPYVAYAQAHHQGERVRFEVGDAQHLHFVDASFDRTLSLLILNFIPDPGKAVKEMVRVTRPGGTIAAAVWDYGEGMKMLRVFWDEAVALNPAADGKDERHMPLSRRGELSELWRRHMLENLSDKVLTMETRFSSFEDFWSPFLERQGPAGAYVATLSANDREQLRLNLRRRLLGEGADRPIVLGARAWAVRGTVPLLGR